MVAAATGVAAVTAAMTGEVETERAEGAAVAHPTKTGACLAAAPF